MSDDASTSQRKRYDTLSAALATRESPVHFAHAGVALVVTVILAGTSARLLWKGGPELQAPAWLLGALAAALFCYAAVRVGLGFSRLKGELKDFAALKALRHELGLDDPARLMPR